MGSARPATAVFGRIQLVKPVRAAVSQPSGASSLVDQCAYASFWHRFVLKRAGWGVAQSSICRDLDRIDFAAECIFLTEREPDIVEVWLNLLKMLLS